MPELVSFHKPETVIPTTSEMGQAPKPPLKRRTSALNTIFFYLGLEQRSGKHAKENECLRILTFAVLFVVFVASAIGFFIMWFTSMYNESLLKQLILTENSTAAELWTRPPVYPLLKVHVFNYTNAKEFLNGNASKLMVEDLGPFVYKETAKKVDVVYNDDGTISYRVHRDIQFQPEESKLLPTAEVVVPNVVFLSGASKKRMESAWSQVAFNVAASANGQSAFTKKKVNALLWGYEDPLLKFAKSMFGTEIETTAFGMLMSYNGTSAENFTVFSGESSLQQLAIIKHMDGKGRLDLWHTDECDHVGGTDGSQFPPHLIDRKQPVKVFIKSLCRKFPLVYDSEVTVLDGIPAWRYKIPSNVFQHPDEHMANHCFCHLESGSCPPSGLFNITGCSMGAPIFASFPHFYTGDRRLIESIEGVEPVQEKHETFADIHPRLAFPIDGALRFQINVQVQKAGMVSGLERFNEGQYLPVIWLEVGSGVIPDELRAVIYHTTYSANAIQMSLRVGTLAIFVLSFVLLVAKCCYHSRSSVKV